MELLLVLTAAKYNTSKQIGYFPRPMSVRSFIWSFSGRTLRHVNEEASPAFDHPPRPQKGCWNHLRRAVLQIPVSCCRAHPPRGWWKSS